MYDLTRAQTLERLPADAQAFTERMQQLDPANVRCRAETDVWSQLEYAAHLRDVLRVQRDRVELIGRERDPELTPMHRDERVVEERYNEQDPAVVARELLDAARQLAALLGALDDDGWQRRGLYTYPTSQLRSVEWIGMHTVHELQHHRLDIGG
ncbi:MAG TPA: DinB family protein [Acidimicrobiia bacterium]